MVGKESGAGSLDPGLMSPRGPWARSRPWGCGGGCLPAASGAGAAAGAAAGGGWGRGRCRGRGWGCCRGRGRDHRFQYGFWLRILVRILVTDGLRGATDLERILVRILVRTACAGLRILNGSWCGFHFGRFFLNDFEDF